MEIEIRDTRNGSWFWVNTAVNACERITPFDKVVYSSLCTFSGLQEIRPTYETIAKRAAVSVRTAKNSIENLEKSGYITLENKGIKGLSNVYTLLKASKGCKKCTACTTRDLEEKEVHATTERSASHVKSSAPRAPQIDIIDINNKKTISAEIDYFPPSKDEIERKEAEDAGFELPAKKPQTNKTAIKLCNWYNDQAVSKEDLCMKGGYFAIVKALKKFGEERIKEIMKYHIDSSRFERNPQVTAALSDLAITRFKREI